MRIGLSLVRSHPMISEYKFFISVTYFILSPARMPFSPSSSRCYTSVYLIRTCTTIRKGPSSVLLPLLLLSFLFSFSLLYCPPLKWLSTHLQEMSLFNSRFLVGLHIYLIQLTCYLSCRIPSDCTQKEPELRWSVSSLYHVLCIFK